MAVGREVQFVYSPGYDLNLGEHVFPAIKYRLVHEKLRAGGWAHPEDFHEPEPAADDDLLLAHSQDWVRRLRDGRLSPEEIVRLEVPYSPEFEAAVRLAVGGSILAGRLALQHGVGFNIGGGFHHAFHGHGEGFCALNDVAVAVRRLQRDGLVRRALVVDVDVHQGNGTASIFQGDDSVFTVSIHQQNNYPVEKPLSDRDVGLPDGCGDEQYLGELERHYRKTLDNFRPDLIFYVAGADPYHDDQLGGLALTMEGLARRDRCVFGHAVERGLPVAVALAGGYARRVRDTVAIHCQTAVAAAERLRGAPIGIA